jgi:hypothetical protein
MRKGAGLRSNRPYVNLGHTEPVGWKMQKIGSRLVVYQALRVRKWQPA